MGESGGKILLTSVALKPYICFPPVVGLSPVSSKVSKHSNYMFIGSHSDCGAVGVHSAEVLAPVELLRISLGNPEESFVYSGKVGIRI